MQHITTVDECPLGGEALVSRCLVPPPVVTVCLLIFGQTTRLREGEESEGGLWVGPFSPYRYNNVEGI